MPDASNTSPVRLGVYGSVIGRVRYGEALVPPPGIAVAGVADPRLRAAQGWARSLGSRTPAFETLTELRGIAPPLEALLVAPTPAARAEILAQVITAGLPSLCELPLVETLEQVDALSVGALATGTMLIPALPRRFDPAFEEASRLIDMGIIGTVTGVRCAWSFPGSGALFAEAGGEHWASELLLYVLCQTADTCRGWLGEVESVSADLELLHPDTRTDVAEDRAHVVGLGNVLLSHTRGQSTLHLLGKRTHQTEERYILTGTEGQFTLTVGTGGTTTVNAATTLTLHRAGEKPEVLYHDAQNKTPDEAMAARMRPLLRHFAGCVRGVEKPVVTLTDARAALEIAHAAYASAVETAKVSLPLRRSPDIAALFRPATPRDPRSAKRIGR